jgi:hypothetical protein
MVINHDILRRDTLRLMTQIAAQIDEVEKEAKKRGLQSTQLKDFNDNWVMSPLLLAKAQAYNTLVMLQTQKK